jgi:hypothetical protein
MRNLNLLILGSISAKIALASDGTFDYAKGGSDWSEAFEACGGENQSPINLPVDGSRDNIGKAKEASGMSWETAYADLSRDTLDRVGDSPNYHTYKMDLPTHGDLTFINHDDEEKKFSLE